MSFLSVVTKDTAASATDTLVSAAFATSGANRHIDVLVGMTSSSVRTVSSMTRTGTTFTHQRTDQNPTGSKWINGAFWMSTAEPQEAAAALTVVASASLQYWGFQAVILDEVNQSTRIRGGSVTRNPDGDGTVANLVLTSETATGDLVVSGILGTGATASTAITGDGTLRGSWSVGSSDGWGLVATAPGAASVTLGWNNTPFRFVHYAASHPPPATNPPVPTVPDDSEGIYSTSSGPTTIDGMSVAEGSGAISMVRVSVPVGLGVWTLDVTGTGVTLTGNNTESVELESASSPPDYNTVLATADFTGAAGVHQAIEVTLYATDGTLEASDTFTILNDIDSLTLTVIEANFAALQTALATVVGAINAGEVSAAFNALATDADLLTDSRDLTLVLPPPTNTAPEIISDGGGAEAFVIVADGESVVTTVQGIDADDDPLLFAIVDVPSGGAVDAALFTIDSLTGLLQFVTPPDYLTPTDDDADGVYDVTVVVSDGTDSDSQIIHVTVTAPALLANAGPDQLITAGSLVQLDGSGSVNYDTLLWEFLLKPDGSLAVLSNAAITNPTFLPDLPGIYSLRLTAFDAASPAESVTDTVIVTAQELAAIVPMYVAAHRPATVPGNRRKAGVPASTIELWKYPKDLYDVAVDWEEDDVLPAGATSLSTLTVVVKDSGGGDVTSSLVADSGVEGFVSWAQLQAGTAGQVYDVIVTQVFNNGQSLDRYVKVQVRDPRSYVVHAPFKYPADKYPIPVEWAGRRPRGNPALSTLITKAYTAVDADETSTYIAGSFVAGTIGAGYILGGSGGESRLLEFAQEFSNGRKFHEYATLTVEVPPA